MGIEELIGIYPIPDLNLDKGVLGYFKKALAFIDWFVKCFVFTCKRKFIYSLLC